MASEEKTSAADIPLKSHEEVVPWTMAREEIQLDGCAADFPVKSNREVENQIVGCAADFPVPIVAADFPYQRRGCAPDFPVQIRGCAPDFPVKSDRENNYKMESGRPSSTDQSNEVSLHIKEIVTFLSKQLETNKASSTCCIYRVPARLRELNEKAYTPRVVSIGPLHHGKENLKAMEDHKIMYLQQFLERGKVSVEGLINVVRDNETELRDCYAETIDLSTEEFAIMILLDAVFIIMVLLKFNEAGEFRGSGDQIFNRPYKLVDVVFDMCLLENQLPFFLLEKLFELLYPIKNRTIMKYTFELLKEVWTNWVNEDITEKIISSEVLHFVDFLRKCQQPTEQHLPTKKINLSGVLYFVDLLRKCQQPTVDFSTEKPSFTSAPTAMELHQSGVKFNNPGRNSLFDIRFSNGILEIPRLAIDDHTETLLRNLQAFEQCHKLYEDRFVGDYITFISCLIHAPNDVEVLARNENLKNMLAVSNLFYNIGKETFISENSFLWDVCEDLNSYCRNRRHKWKATLKQVYFNNPWTAISVAAATFLLILTVIQTVCSILQLR